MSAGSPITINAGIVRFEPPPAIVFMMPAKKPIDISRLIVKKVISYI
jgi:hypothetical protein